MRLCRRCSDGTFVGPGGLTPISTRSWQPSPSLPSVTLSLPNNRYFQYRATLATDDAAYSPQLHDVSVGPDHYAVNASQGSCAAPSASSFTCDARLAGRRREHHHRRASGTRIPRPSASSPTPPTSPARGPIGSVLSSTAIVTSTVIAQTDLAHRQRRRLVRRHGSGEPRQPDDLHAARLQRRAEHRLVGEGHRHAAHHRVRRHHAHRLVVPRMLGNALTCTVASLLRYDWQDIRVTGNAPTIEGMITNTAWITTATEISTTDNIYTQTTLVTPLADLSIAKSAYPDPVNPGETLTYTLVVTNSGPYTATNVIVTDTLQSGLIGRGFGAGWSCGLPGNVVICSLLYPLTPSQSARFNITVTAPMSGVLRNDAIVTSNTYDPDRYDPDTDNAVTTFAAVRPVADLALNKSDTPDPVNAGTPLTYTITVTNAGPVPAGALTTTLIVRQLSFHRHPVGRKRLAVSFRYVDLKRAGPHPKHDRHAP